MTRIGKNTPINTLQRMDAKQEPSRQIHSKKTQTTKPHELSELKKKVRQLIDDSSLPPAKRKEKIIQSIVEWQFSGTLVQNRQYTIALKKLNDSLTDSSIYQQLIDDFIKHDIH